jgi:hypothetical protein
MADSAAPVSGGLSEEDLAMLTHTDLVEDPGDPERHDELGYPAPAGFRERLVLGDISW